LFSVPTSPSAVQRDSAQLNGPGPSAAADPPASVNPTAAPFGIVPAVALPSVVVSTGITVPSAILTDNASSVSASFVRRRWGGQGLPAPETRARPATSPGRHIEPAVVQAEESFKNAVTSLAESLRLDLTALDEALSRCLSQLDYAENTPAELVEYDALTPWLAVAAIASSASAAAVSWHGRTRTNPPAVILGAGTSYSSEEESDARF
jgi:hypothetical protein